MRTVESAPADVLEADEQRGAQTVTLPERVLASANARKSVVSDRKNCRTYRDSLDAVRTLAGE